MQKTTNPYPQALSYLIGFVRTLPKRVAIFTHNTLRAHCLFATSVFKGDTRMMEDVVSVLNLILVAIL